MTTTSLAQTTLSCGCVRDGQGTLKRCPESNRLWSELIEARDALRDNERTPGRIGRKRAIDAFAGARDAYRLHIGVER